LPRPIGVIQKPGLIEDLLGRLSVNRPREPFVLDGDVVPVVLIDSGVAFVASPSPAYLVSDIFTIGSQVAPAIDTVLADTGQLPTGSYTANCVVSAEEGALFEFQWRNAANAANLWTQILRLHVTSGIGFIFFDFRLTVANANERFRILNAAAGGVGINYQATIMARI